MTTEKSPYSKKNMVSDLRAEFSLRFVVCPSMKCFASYTWEKGQELGEIQSEMKSKGWVMRDKTWYCRDCAKKERERRLLADVRRE